MTVVHGEMPDVRCGASWDMSSCYQLIRSALGWLPFIYSPSSGPEVSYLKTAARVSELYDAYILHLARYPELSPARYKILIESSY